MAPRSAGRRPTGRRSRLPKPLRKKSLPDCSQRRRRPLRDGIAAFWAAHGTKTMAAAAFVINGADFLLVEILEVLPPSWRPATRLAVMALDYCIVQRSRRLTY